MGFEELVLILFATAFLLIAAGIVVMLLTTFKAWKSERRVEGGAVLIVGPLPLVFATGERVARSLILLAIILTVLAVAIFLLLTWLLPALVRA